MRTPKFKPERERQLLDPNEDPIDRANAITCLESDGVVKHENIIVSFLDNPSPELRAAAIKILLRWGRFEYTELAIDWLKHDHDEHVRGTMTSALAYVAHVGQHFDAIARALVFALENDNDRDVARRAYEAARVIIVPEDWFATKIDVDTFDRRRDVDWNLLAPYRTSTSSTRPSTN
jgi:hypothetical protein